MSQINTNVQAMLANRVLGQQNQGLNTALERLSTGLRINRGADDPAGLIASENLRSEKAAIDAAIGNAERADQVMNIAEGGMQEINDMLIQLQSLTGQSANDAGLSAEEKDANQQQVDSILETIDRLASTTSFQGQKLLDGSMAIQTTNQHEDVEHLRVDAAAMGTNEEIDLDVNVSQNSTQAQLLIAPEIDTGELALDGAETLEFSITGPTGATHNFSFADGDDAEDIEAAINAVAEELGVTVEEEDDEITLTAIEYGSEHSISINVTDDGDMGTDLEVGDPEDPTEDPEGDTVTVSGTDLEGTINGITAQAVGNEMSINSGGLSATIELDVDEVTEGETFTAATITGGGAKFNLGPQINQSNEVRLALHQLDSANLGHHSIGFLDELGLGRDANMVDGDLTKAQQIVDEAVKQVSSQRGRLGAFQQNTIGSTIRSLGVAMENTAAAESAIRDTDFAAETAELTRSQILSQAAMNSLSLANNQPQAVLQLLG